MSPLDHARFWTASAVSYKYSRKGKVKCCSRGTYIFMPVALTKPIHTALILDRYSSVRRQRRSTLACQGSFHHAARLARLAFDEVLLFLAVLLFRKNFHVFSKAILTVRGFNKFLRRMTTNEQKTCLQLAATQPPQRSKRLTDILCPKVAIRRPHLRCSDHAKTRDPANCHRDQWYCLHGVLLAPRANTTVATS